MEPKSAPKKARERWHGVVDWFNSLELSENAILIAFSLVIGVLSALGVAAFSAAFNAPIAGAFFALEEILGSLAVTAFPPVVVASVIAAVVSRAVFGNHPAFPIPVEYSYGMAREVFLFFPLLGVVTGAVAALFVRVFFGTETIVKRLTRWRWLIPWIGGALVGLL